ncbi:PQQ-dependent sugar dehydrogenase [Microvirga soli]|uniref:PQQ-dependent sugar dehydrogenase n=1 Tax=Microvirga soli TaxID=1854496 RepID=UPI00191EDCCE|nr:PQQ-dependent sugar dehydrogenase [Microvirga soli]
MATIYGSSGADDLTNQATNEDDTIYGYNPNASEIVGTRIASGLTQPLFVTGAPDNSGRLFIVGKQGTVQIVGADGSTAPTPFLDVTDQVSTAGEVGLLGFTFHPDFANNGKVYVFLSLKGENNSDPRHNESQIREYTVNPNSPDVLPSNYKVILETTEYTEGSGNHRAGWIGFSPTDGYLYVATGDGDQNWNAQNPTSHLGKILRLDVDSLEDAYPGDPKKNFAIPEGNPTVFDNAPDLAQPSEVYAIGFRNPWRASFDKDGRLFVGDVGADTAEEINLVVPGANYGWGRPENDEDEDPSNDADDGPTPETNDGYTDGIHSYFHEDGIGASVTGGYVYDGPIASLRGKYIFGDFGSARIWTLEETASGWVRNDITATIVPSAGTIERIASFGTDRNGNLYVVDISGEVFRLDAGGGGSDLGDTLDGAGGNDTIYGGGGDDTIYGGADSDRIYGDEGNDTIYGGNATGTDDSADTLTGGNGDDTYYVSSGDTVIELASTVQSNDEVRAIESFTLGAGQAVEVLRAWPADSEVALDLTGNELAQRLIGNAGANVLNGDVGPDTLMGGAGNDTYVADGMDTIVETNDDGSDAGGIDTVRTALNNYTLGTNLENLTLLGTAAINGSGNSLDNIITGNSAANSLSGGDGVDTLIGGGGNDTLNGGNRSDSLEGGAGDDTYRIYGEETIEEAAGMGIDTVIVVGEANYTLGAGIHVEILKANPDSFGGNLTGNELNNTLYGNKGRNSLDGGAGEDTVVLSGKRADYTIERNGDGSFTLTDAREDGDRVDTITQVEIFKFADITSTAGGLLLTDFGLTGDVVEENSQTGFEFGDFSIKGAVGTLHFELLSNAEGRFAIDNKSGKISVADGVRLDYEQAKSHLVEVQVTDATGASMRKTFTIQVGNSLNETATGSALGDVLKGGEGQDAFKGAGGNDRLYGDLGNDRLYGESGDDTLEGSSGDDLLDGGLNNDRLIGGLGKDTLTGGKGRDVFVFDDRETGSSKSKADYITDFSGRGGDRIDLKLIDANTKKRGDQKFSFIGDDKSFSKAGEVRFEKTKSTTYVYLNTDSDKTAEAVIKLKGSIELSKSWFVL